MPMINAIQTKLEGNSGEMLGITRMLAAFMFLQHETHKMFGFPVEAGGPYELLSLLGIAGLTKSLVGCCC